jgi:conjugative relaxase-like TrwC/TraI family protein
VLSVVKLRVGQEAYHLTGVAKSLDDYYTGAGEAPGWWAGVGAERLGLAGEVDGDDLRALLGGMAPGTGGLSPNGEEIKPHPRRVPGFDLTWKAPKSLSVLYAVSDDPRVQGAIIEACEAALHSTLAWLERDVIRVRRGTGNQRWLSDLAAHDPGAAEQAKIRVQPVRGVAAAVFRHRTSRAGDPLLHWHVLLPNLVEGVDGRWSAFVHPELYRYARAAGEVFQTAVRAEATERLGLVWRPGRHVPEVAGVPQSLCDRFSKRSRERDAWLAATGTASTPRGRQAAVLATRQHKPEVEGERFDAIWKAEALDAGWGPDAAEALIATLTPEAELPVEGRWRLPEWMPGPDGDPVLHDRLVDPDDWIAHLLETELTLPDATFTRPQLVQAVAARLGDGATVATVERVTARVLASAHVVPVHDLETQRWTSVVHLRRERRLLDTAHQSRNALTPVATRAVRKMVAARPTLGHDQADAVRTVCASRDGVTVLVGPAGTGKTFTLDAIRDAYQRAGYHVIGAAPSALGALELSTGAHLPAQTVHRLLGRWARGIDLPDKHTVLVVDEAGMAATRELEPLVSQVVGSGGRVLLVGDHRQLPSVTAGGAFGALATDEDSTVATLTINRRQRHAWERAALAELRDGKVPEAVDAYRDHHRVVAVDDPADLIDAAVNRYFAAHQDGLRPVLYAGTNDTARTLNHTVRRRLITQGHLPAEPALSWAGRDYAIGDRVLLRHNSYHETTLDGAPTELLNGEAGTVIDGGPAGLLVRLDLGERDAIVRADYIAAGHLDHAYALTTTRTQGGTWDLGIGVGTDGLYREAGYTGLSRGRHSNWLVLTRAELDDIDTELANHNHGIPLPSEEPDDVTTELTHRLERSRAKLLALTRDPHADHVAHLADTLPLAELEAIAQRCRAIEAEATRVVGCDPRVVADEVARAQHTATHLAIGYRVKAHDRGNIGTIVGYDDHAGTVTVHFISPDGAEADKDLPWAAVEIVNPRQPDPRQLPPEAQATLDALLEPVREALAAWHAHLAARGIRPLDAQHHERAATLATDRATHHLTAQQPDWLHHLLGPRPETPMAATVWDDATRHIAAHRTHHHLPRDVDGIGPPPSIDSDEHDAWSQASAHLARTRIWLATHDTQPMIPLTRARSTAELQARREHLEGIFATAPRDQSRLIESLTNGQLTLDDAAQVLDRALAAHGARRDWILEHWSHVVEHAEITRSLTAHAQGPDLRPLLDQLAVTAPSGQDSTSPEALLAAAARADLPWLRGFLGNVLPADATRVDDATRDLLGRVAAYRYRWRISHRDPLGPAASTPAQTTQRAALAEVLSAAWVRAIEPHGPVEPQLAVHAAGRPDDVTADDLRSGYDLGI